MTVDTDKLKAQCTRCGGQHALSRCPWPAAYKERTEG